MKLISRVMQYGLAGDRWNEAAWPAALLFFAATFALSSFRASLNPDTSFDLLEPKRIGLMATGAVVFWLAVKRANRHRPDLRDLGRMAMVAVPGMAVLFAIAAGWDILIDRRMDNFAVRNLRWILLWSGYFGTGIAAWLVVRFASALAVMQAAQAGDSQQAGEGDSGFWVKTGRQTVRIAQESVEWMRAEGNYVRIHGADGAQGLVRSTLSAIEGKLKMGDFVRVHRSALCRRTAIRGYRRQPSGAMRALLASGAEAPLGRSYAAAVIDAYPQLHPDPRTADDTVSPPGPMTRRA